MSSREGSTGTREDSESLYNPHRASEGQTHENPIGVSRAAFTYIPGSLHSTLIRLQG